MPHNTDDMSSVNKATIFHCDGQKKKVNKLKKVMKRRTPVKTTENEHKDSKPANNEADHDSDSNDDINVILLSIAEQRKFAEGASHIAKLQKFQKVLDKLGLRDVMKKYYVLSYMNVWAWAAGEQYQVYVTATGTGKEGDREGTEEGAMRGNQDVEWKCLQDMECPGKEKRDWKCINEEDCK